MGVPGWHLGVTSSPPLILCSAAPSLEDSSRLPARAFSSPPSRGTAPGDGGLRAARDAESRELAGLALGVGWGGGQDRDAELVSGEPGFQGLLLLSALLLGLTVSSFSGCRIV